MSCFFESTMYVTNLSSVAFFSANNKDSLTARKRVATNKKSLFVFTSCKMVAANEHGVTMWRHLKNVRPGTAAK